MVLRKNNVLVIDDSKVQQELYRGILEDAGYNVTVAEGGEQALRLAQECHFNLVLTDDKTTGTGRLMLAVELIKDDPHRFVLMITTGSEKALTPGSVQEILSVLRGSMFGYLEKPVDLDSLLRAVGSGTGAI